MNAIPIGKSKSFPEEEKFRMGKINLINLQKKILIDSAITRKIKRAVSETILSESSKKKIETNICFVNDKKIKEFNKKFLAIDKPTDVIVFDTVLPENSSCIMADMVISADTAISNSKIFKTSPLCELLLYVIHGTLHVLGYVDKNKKQKDLMQEKAQRILNKLNIK